VFGLRAGRRTDRDSIIGRGKKISPILNLQTASAVHPALYPEVPVVPSLEVKRLEREAGHSPPSDAQVKPA
jgi:hypothetical protein